MSEASNKIKELEATIKIYRDRNTALEKEIWELEEKRHKNDKVIGDAMIEIEKLTYHGMTQREYFSSIRGRKFVDGDIHVEIGMPYEHFILAKRYDGDLELSVNCSYERNSSGLKVYRKADHQKGTKWYERDYYGHDIPKKRKDDFNELMEVIKKYSEMMAKGEI